MLLLDQEDFDTLWGRGETGVLMRLGLPTVLMVNQRTQRIIDRAVAAGITTVVEKPLLGGVLIAAIQSVLGEAPASYFAKGVSHDAQAAYPGRRLR